MRIVWELLRSHVEGKGPPIFNGVILTYDYGAERQRVIWRCEPRVRLLCGTIWQSGVQGCAYGAERVEGRYCDDMLGDGTIGGW